jgi:hypothetical protein
MRTVDAVTQKLFDEITSMRAGRTMGIPRAEGEELYFFIKEHNIKRVIETGIYFGFTSRYILEALPQDGKLYSIEPKISDRIGDVVPTHLHEKWEKISGTSRDELLKCFLKNRDIDLFFHDSLHTFENMLFEYKTAHPFVTFIGSHDIALTRPRSAWDEIKRKGLINVITELGQLGLGAVTIPKI